MNFLTTSILAAALALTGSTALADEIVITHRSGKVQILPINDAGDPVEQVSFRKSRTESNTLPAPAAQQTPVPTPGGKALTPPAINEKVVVQKPVETPKSPDKPAVKFKWAEPRDPQ